MLSAYTEAHLMHKFCRIYFESLLTQAFKAAPTVAVSTKYEQASVRQRTLTGLEILLNDLRKCAPKNPLICCHVCDTERTLADLVFSLWFAS